MDNQTGKINTSNTERFNAIMAANAPKKKQKAKSVTVKQIEPRENMNNLQTSLSKCTYTENTVYLPFERLSNYTDVRKALLNAGATYKNNTFIFPNNAELFINKLMGGEMVNIKKQFQFFATPAKLAKEIINEIPFYTGAKVGEFSAGQGALLDELPNLNLQLTVCELMPENCEILRQKGYNVVEGDFLTQDWQMQDFIIGNPPFSKNQDIDHFMHMYKFLKEGGRMDVITSCHWLFANDKKSVKFREFINESANYQEIEAGEFKESGTNIKTVLITLIK